jgi:hypothetical protein
LEIQTLVLTFEEDQAKYASGSEGACSKKRSQKPELKTILHVQMAGLL